MDDFQANLEKSRDAWARFNRVADDVRALYPHIVYTAQDHRNLFNRLSAHAFFLYCQEKTGVKANHKAPGFPYLAEAMAPTVKSCANKNPWGQYPEEAKKQVEDKLFSSFQKRTRPIACSWSPESGRTGSKLLFKFYNPYLKELECEQKKQRRLSVFDFQTVMAGLLSVENEQKFFKMPPTAIELPRLLVALADLEQVCRRLERGDNELVPTAGHFFMVEQALKAIGNAINVKIGELAGAWAGRVEYARNQAAASQAKQKERRKIVARFVEAAGGDRQRCITALLDEGLIRKDMQRQPPYGRKRWRPEGIPEHPLATSLAIIEKDIKTIEGPKPAGRPRKS